MRTILTAILVLGAVTGLVTADDDADVRAGLVAHYWMDPEFWNGAWPDEVSAPAADPSRWTFTEYKYSRVEPTVNHMFVNKGWFTVRWVGMIDVRTETDGTGRAAVTGRVNVNPGRGGDNAFVMVLQDGSEITEADLRASRADYTGTATLLKLVPKGNANTNMLSVDGKVYPLRNGENYQIASDSMRVTLTNDARNSTGKAMGQWWLTVSARNAAIYSNNVEAEAAGGAGDDYLFEVLADDGCRLMIDGRMLIDSWRPCWEDSPQALRRAVATRLPPGRYRIVIEYFQGQSLSQGDYDPIKFYWSSQSRKIARQLVPVEALYHTPSDLRTTAR